MGFHSKCNFTPPTIFLGFSFVLGHRVPFFGRIQHSPVSVCSALICSFGVLTGEDAHPSIPPSWIQDILFIIGNWNMLKIHCSKFILLKILQARLQEYLNRELLDVQVASRKGRETRIQIANISWIIEKARELQKCIYFCLINYTKAFDRVDHNKLWKILEEIGIPDHPTCLLRNLYANQEATVRTGHGTMDWFLIGKGVLLFNLYAEYIM